MEGAGISDTTATLTERTFDIIAKDAYGNVASGINMADITVNIDVSGAPLPTPNQYKFSGGPVFISEGVYRVTYAPETPGRYYLTGEVLQVQPELTALGFRA